ncbi:MAG: hypothetical protein E7662_03275 [Ruminococcaceae bacterium]|nr:hypothetical protein [Oscillospiraceae bacterium]
MRKKYIPALALLAAALILIGIAAGQLIRRGKDTDTGEALPTDIQVTEQETTAPVTTVPETSAPDTTAPVTSAPVTTAPDTTAPDTTAPVTTAPDTTAPATSAPVTTVPDTTAPETTAPPHSHAPAGNVLCDADRHWYLCSCGITLRESAHADYNLSGKCDLCGYPMPVETQPPQTSPAETQPPILQEGEALQEILQPAQITLLRPEASGTLTAETKTAVLDYSHTGDGYIMIRFTEEVTERLKVKLEGPTTTYTYNIKPLEWTVFPLSDGNGEYRATVYRNISGSRYAAVLAQRFTAQMENEFAPFLRPNQYVNYENAVNTMNKAAELSAGITDTLKKVEAIYSYVTRTITYDYDKAGSVQSGYLPDLDRVLEEKKGICFDYAALMTGMLRSQNIACKLIVGYADSQYHAWISVWTPDKGWIDGAIFFDGEKWQRMDPTFASAGGSKAMEGVVYTSKYIY